MVLFLAQSLALPALSSAEEAPAAWQEQVQNLAQPLVQAKGPVVGLSLGAIRQGDSFTTGLGVFSRGDPRVPDATSLYEIGSISKTFTGILLAEFVRCDLMKLQDPVQDYLPESVIVPTWPDRPITLLDLATHSSGLPRMPNNFRPAQQNNPYADYTTQGLYAFLSGHKLRRAPGQLFEYSNLGAGLLGHTLARRVGLDYQELVLQHICRPLGMESTRLVLDDEMRKRLVPGHNGRAMPAANWDIPTLAGAGGLRSTVQDMMKYLEANLSPDSTPLGPAIRAAHQPRYPLGEGKAAIGLGWHIAQDGRTLWHNGMTGGYRSFCALDPDSRTAVVILTNTAHPSVDEAGWKIMEALKETPAME